ncbi:MAG: SCO family protein [Candidatus Kapabacteria bacterium]|nr:SCO family protein [Candidatus Kapabacteria bacterium]
MKQVILMLLIVVCAGGNVVAQKQTSCKQAKKHSCCSAEESPLGKFSDKSLYQVQSKWVTQNSAKIELSSFAGSVVVTTMIFTNCTYACPQIIADVKKIAGSVPADVVKNIKFVFISMDVKRDTPKALRAFAEKMNIADSNWIFLHGNEDDTREIAALLGIKFKKMPSGDFSHSNIISVLNKQGEIVYQQNGLNAEPLQTIQAIEKADKEVYTITQ